LKPILNHSSDFLRDSSLNESGSRMCSPKVDIDCPILLPKGEVGGQREGSSSPYHIYDTTLDTCCNKVRQQGIFVLSWQINLRNIKPVKVRFRQMR
jgi:hypothetical protein